MGSSPSPVRCCRSAFISYALKIASRNCSNEPNSIGLPVSLLVEANEAANCP